MSAIVLDECMYQLYQAQECYKDYKEIEVFSEIFEAEDPKVKEQIETNNKATTGALGHIKKAAQAVLNTIRNLISSIGDFFRKRGMDEKERKAYEDFKKAAANDPELKNKKITVLDYRKFQAEYDQLLKETEEAEREIANNKDYPLDTLTEKITSWCGNAGKGLVVSVGCEAALNVASSSRDMANKILATLKTDEQMWNTLCDSIGEKEAKKFEKQITSLGKRVSLQNLKMKLKGTASKSVEEAFEKTLNSVEELAVGGATVARNVPANDPSKSGFSNKVAMAKGLVTHPGDTIKGAVKVGKNASMVQRAMGNEAIKKGVSTAVSASGEMNKSARNMWLDEHRPKKKRFKKPESYRDQSAKSAVLGEKDPNSTLSKVKGVVG
jgi:hypothetical protein